MNACRPLWRFCVMACAAVILLSVPAVKSTAYDTAAGTKPELQAKQTVDSQTRPISYFTIIREPGGPYEDIADILAGELGLSTDDLTAQEDTLDQIIIGDVSNSTIATLASLNCMNAIDLGEEGYSFVSKPNPRSSNGSWIVFILGAEGGSKGVLRGAYTLLDLLADNGSSEIGNYRIRDYPDRPYRGLMHWVGYINCNGADWVATRKANIELVAGTGCTALHFGKSEFGRMDEHNVYYDNEKYGRWMNELAYWSRYYGMEPIPEIWGPGYSVGVSHPLWREGEFIKDEPFDIVQHIDGNDTTYLLEPAISPFDNDTYNMDLESGDTWPDVWNCSSSWQGWSYEKPPGDDRYLRYSGSNSTYLKQLWDDSVLRQNSFYVLECIFSDVDTGGTSDDSPWLAISVKNSSNNWQNIFHEQITDRSGEFTKDFFFWTPPDSLSAPEGYPGNWDPYDFHPYYDDVTEIRLMIYRLSGDNLSFNFHGCFLERRAGALRNVMYDPTNVLDLTIEDENGDPYSPGWYDLDCTEEDSLSWKMPTHVYKSGNLVNNVSEIEWTNTDTIPSQVWVSYTAGVPYDYCAGGQKTTWCLKNPELLDFIEDVLTTFYSPYTVDVNGLTEYTLNPKYIDIRLDEIRGTNRCGRCADFDVNDEEIQDNPEHLTDYIETFQGILDNLTSTYPEAANTKLIVSANMISRWRNGSDPAYQFRFGGPWGCFDEGDLAPLGDVDNDIIFTMTHVNKAHQARAAGWPRSDASGLDNLFVIGTMQCATSSEPDSAVDFASNSTWYEEDALGFMSIGYDDLHTEEEELLLDFAWTRYRNPDATMQVFQGCHLVTDDVGGRTVEIEVGDHLYFAPFGHPEMRVSETNDYTITDAEIDWDVGSPDDVLSILNEDDILHTYQGEGTFDVTLTVTAEPAGGGTPVDYSVVIPVDVVDPDPDPPPGSKKIPIIGSSQEVPERYALHQNHPNPFNPSTSIHFDLPEPASVKLAVYNIKGELVRTLVDDRLSAGWKAVSWDGKNNRGADVASGIYFYRIKAAAFTQSRKMILLR